MEIAREEMLDSVIEVRLLRFEWRSRMFNNFWLHLRTLTDSSDIFHASTYQGHTDCQRGHVTRKRLRRRSKNNLLRWITS